MQVQPLINIPGTCWTAGCISINYIMISLPILQTPLTQLEAGLLFMLDCRRQIKTEIHYHVYGRKSLLDNYDYVTEVS